MIENSKETDEKINALKRAVNASATALAPPEIWCLHGAVGAASDWRELGKKLAEQGISTRAVDLWRFLEAGSMTMPEFGKRLNAEAAGEVFRGQKRILMGYSMGGRLALHALLAGGPWDGVIIISANPGLRDPGESSARRASDAAWAEAALTLPWDSFIEKWNAQPLLGGPMRDVREDKKLIHRRREIARSFVDWSVGNQAPLWARLPEIQQPVLWISGENDSKYTAIAHDVFHLCQKMTVTSAPGCGHRVPWENDVWLTAQISDWIEDFSI